MTTSVASQGGLGSTDHPPNGGGMTLSGVVGTDSLQDRVAGMSKHQLYQLVSQMKDLIHQNQQQARDILIANPQLTKTLFQAQIMLGMVRAPPDTLSAVAASAPPTRPPQVQHPAQLPQEALPIPSPQPPAAVLQSLPNQQSAPPPDMAASPYLQQSQVSGGAAVQLNQPSFSFQQSSQPHPQSSPLTNPGQQLQSQPLAGGSTLQPSIQHQPPPPLHPPLPQQPRPVAAAPQIQHPNTQAVGFTSHPSQPYQTQSSYLQQGGPSQNSAAGPPFQQILTPPLPSQPLPQQMFQVPQSGNFNGVLPTSGGALETGGRGLSMGISSSASAPLMTWNQAVPSSVPMMGVPQVTPVGATMNMVPGHNPFSQTGSSSSMAAPGPNPNPPQVFNQPMAQAQPPQQLQHQPQALQMQMPIELEQQKALLQQVMNLTPEQINSLPPEQRQQVLQLQQAFRSQTG